MPTTVEFYPKDQQAVGMREGDFLLTHDKNIIGWLVRFGQRLRYEEPYARWNHAVLVLSDLCIFATRRVGSESGGTPLT